MTNETTEGRGAADEKPAQEPGKRGRGRPPGSKNKPKDSIPASDGKVASDDNEAKSSRTTARQPSVGKEPMTDEQEHALTSHHTEAYKKALERKKKADADFKNTCKLAKAEGVSLKQIKEYISYQTEEGREQLRIDLERKQKVARWAGLPVGTQLNFLDEVDRTPIDERTKADGKRAGLKGEEAVPPKHTPVNLVTVWMEGWHEGQKLLADRIKQKHEEQRAEDAKAFDDELPGKAAPAEVDGGEGHE